jgi:hypothetical protein
MLSRGDLVIQFIARTRLFTLPPGAISEQSAMCLVHLVSPPFLHYNYCLLFAVYIADGSSGYKSRNKNMHYDRLCGLVVRVLGYRSGGPGSIPGTARFSGKKKKRKENSSGSGTGSTQPREYN